MDVDPRNIGGRWRGASTGVDRRPQLDQTGHVGVGDRHGLASLAEPAR
jgi:hypothetical protein